MILPVSVLRIRIMEDGKRKVRLWLPVFLVWPLVLALMVVLSPVALVLCVVWPGSRRWVFGGPKILAACWALRGLEVRVQDDEDQVLVSFR